MSHFDESSYKSRFQKYCILTDVKQLLHDPKKIEATKKNVEYNGRVSKEELNLYAACVHPATKQIIPPVGRMAFFVPINIPICAGMLFSKPIVLNLIAWQWINQTYNAVFNYCNSPKGSTLPKSFNEIPKPLLKEYSGSVAVSVGLAVGLTQWIKKGRCPPSMKPLLQKVVPYMATSSAGVANVFLMRREEMKTGIPVQTMNKETIGYSKIAAKRALFETAMSRAVLPIPMLLLPTPFIAIASRFNICNSTFMRRKLTELLFLVPCIALGLPAALALYPQYTNISINALEPEIAALKDQFCIEDTVQYNKGV